MVTGRPWIEDTILIEHPGMRTPTPILVPVATQDEDRIASGPTQQGGQRHRLVEAVAAGDARGAAHRHQRLIEGHRAGRAPAAVEAEQRARGLAPHDEPAGGDEQRQGPELHDGRTHRAEGSGG